MTLSFRTSRAYGIDTRAKGFSVMISSCYAALKMRFKSVRKWTIVFLAKASGRSRVEHLPDVRRANHRGRHAVAVHRRHHTILT
jgi:hypothetical protein